jgi:hypothetical protein
LFYPSEDLTGPEANKLRNYLGSNETMERRPLQTIPVKHPGGSDTKTLSPGSYTISDRKYSPPMSGNITVQGNVHLEANDLVVGGLFVPTPSLSKYKADFASAGFQVLSEYNFLSKVVQKDIAGPTTLIIYFTTMPIQNAITNLKPIIASLPYR